MKQVINNSIYEPWPWWVGGPLIGLFVIVLLLVERKQLGISSSYQYVCAKVSPIKLAYFKNPEKASWQFWFSIGLVLGGVLLVQLDVNDQVAISSATISSLNDIGVTDLNGYAPVQLYNFTPFSIGVLGLGGLLVGFGARYANGCTAGHAIMGCAQLSLASILATVCFFVGGLLATYFINPYLF